MDKQVEIVTMTPEMARALLEKNTRNRNLSQGAVDAYARDMLAGRFQFNGDAIRVMDNGDLADGQHRLWACVQSERPFQTLLVTGLTNGDLLTIDRHRKRSAGDVMSILGVDSGNRVASAIRSLYSYATQDVGARLTAHEITAIHEAHPRLGESVKANAKIEGSRGTVSIQSGAFTALHYVAGVLQGNGERIESFLATLTGRRAPAEDDPAFRLQQALLRDRAARSAMRPITKLSLITNAWSHYAKGSPLKVLKPGADFRLEKLNDKTLHRYTG